MKAAILFSIVVLCQGEVLIRVPGPDEFGQSVQYKNQDVLGNYDFGYDEAHPSGGSFRKEAGDVYGNKVGSYGLRDADGRIRIVNYVADAGGFRVDVRTNEPGVAPQDPASVTINRADGVLPPPVAPIPPPVVPVGPVPFSPLGLPVQPPVVPPAFPTVVKGFPPSPLAPPPPPPPARGYAFPGAPPVAKFSGPTVKYPAPALQYPIPVPAYTNTASAIRYYGGYPYTSPYLLPPPAAPKAVATTVPVARYTVPVRYGYSGSPPLPAYQVLQYPY